MTEGIKAYHNCTLDTAELIKTDGVIRSNAELQHMEHNRVRNTGLSTKDTRFVFLYPGFFQHSKDRSTYRGAEYVAFVFDAVQLIEKYSAFVGKDVIHLDYFAGLIPDIRKRTRAQAEIRKNNRWQGDTALKQLRKGMENPIEVGVMEILVPQAILLADCIGLVNANTEEILQSTFDNPGAHTQAVPIQNRRRKRRRRRK